MKKNLFFAALAAIALFASCAKDNGETTDNGKTKNVYMKLEKAPSVRSVADKVTDYTVEFSSGLMYFVDAAGDIRKVFTIDGNPTAGSNLNITDLENGLGGIEVPETSKTVYVIANLPSGFNPATAGAYSAVSSKVLSAASQVGTITSGAIKGVVLYGGAANNIDEVSTGVFEATVSPMQVCNRFEITDISLKTDSHITGYTVDGIYVNYFYSERGLGVAPLATANQNYGSIAANYVSTYGFYASAGAGVFYDEPAAAATSGVVAAGTDKVWGYNLLAGAITPHIIIKLSNITVETGWTAPTGGTGFITVKGFNKTAGGAAIDFATGGQVFTVAAGDLAFALEDVTSVPEMGSIEVKVTVELTDWIPVGVKPVI